MSSQDREDREARIVAALNASTSKAVSARYPVACPTCKAEIGEPCRSKTTNRVTDTHRARIDAAYPTTP